MPGYSICRREFLAGGAALAGCSSTTDIASVCRFNDRSVELSLVPGSPKLQMRRVRQNGPAVLYIHGSSFPSALSVGYRFSDGASWEDDLANSGFDSWALDFSGFGGSERPREFSDDAEANGPILRATEAAEQILRAVRYIQDQRRNSDPISIIAHSWGTAPAALFVSDHPDKTSGFVMFGPVLKRNGRTAVGNVESLPAWRLVTLAQQRSRFSKDVPTNQDPVLVEPSLTKWGARWLASDPDAQSRTPPSVKVPGGSSADLREIWGGNQIYDPNLIKRPLMIVRGQWDSVCTTEDVALFREARFDKQLHDVVVPRATHLMHFEHGRIRLRAVTNDFLLRTTRRFRY
ncbi:MAG: alpha/beta hydrolase [Pseudomonadota bacterium]